MIDVEIQKALIENAHKVLPHLKLVHNEFLLLPAKKILLQDSVDAEDTHIGRIDVILKYKRKIYVTEIKCTPYNNKARRGFWDSLKVLGYNKYYQWQTGMKSYPAIILPSNSIRLEQQIVAELLGIKIFGSFEENGEVRLEEMDKQYSPVLVE